MQNLLLGSHPPLLYLPPLPPPQSVSESYQQDGGDDAAVEDQSLAPINEASGVNRVCGKRLGDGDGGS